MLGRRSAGDEVGRRVAHTGSLAMKTGNASTKAPLPACSGFAVRFGRRSADTT
jgi:hypothetical protein